RGAGRVDAQPSRLAFWKGASDEINYRRFFDVNELAAVSIEHQEVFAATHEFVLRLLSEGQLDGLRIDHPDGLYDPAEYLHRLQEHYFLAVARTLCAGDEAWEEAKGPLLERFRAGEGKVGCPLYVVVEKILGSTEPLPADWPTHGTTGYEFLNLLSGLFVDPAGATPFTRLYQAWSGMEVSFAEMVYQKKFLILQVALSS